MRASKSKDIVEIQRTRGVHDLQPMCGYVLDASPVFALVQPIQDRLDLDGYDVIRQSDIERVRPVAAARAAFYGEVLAWRGQRRKRPLGIDLTSMQTVLESVARRYALIAVHYERKDHTTCGVGRILRTTRTTCLLDWITPEATFDGEHRRYRLADLTRVQFGNDYEEALAAVHARRGAARVTHQKGA